MLCELLGGALAGQWTIVSPERRDYGATVNHMLSIVIDRDAFGGRDGFEGEATIFVDALRQTPPAKGIAMVQLPGDPERAATASRRQGGLGVDDHTWASLVKAAAVLGLAPAAIVTRSDGAS